LRLLLTSGGIKNPSIERALVEVLRKPIAEASALCISTASYALIRGPELAYEYFTGTTGTPMCELGWKGVGVLELTALPTVDEERWVASVRKADVLLVNGGDPMYLCHWMRESGLAARLPSLEATAYVGLSAGSMVMTPRIGEDFVNWRPPTDDDITLGFVDFSIYPHLDHPELPNNTMANAVTWAAGLGNPAYAIDDDTAIKVVDGSVEVVSEGHWREFAVV